MRMIRRSFMMTARTAEIGFSIKEMSADCAYGSNVNFTAVEATGGTFYPMFKANTTGACGGSFQKAFHYFGLNKEEYLTHYHKRSNVESTVSMIKRKFGDAVKSKNDLAQKNEVYAKFVCHNLCVLIQEMYVIGIDPTFCGNSRNEMASLKFPGKEEISSNPLVTFIICLGFCWGDGFLAGRFLIAST